MVDVLATRGYSHYIEVPGEFAKPRTKLRTLDRPAMTCHGHIGFQSREFFHRRPRSTPVLSEIRGRTVELRPLRRDGICRLLFRGDERVAGNHALIRRAPERHVTRCMTGRMD